MKNEFKPFSRNDSRLKKWWLTKTIEKGRIIESGNFNDDLYNKFKKVVSQPIKTN
jgi:hypothetical protein